MTTWIGIALSVAWLFMAETALASSPVGPREAVEAAVGRFMTIIQNGRPDGAAVGERSDQIRQIVREMFDFDEISRRALSRHWQAREDQAEFVTLFRDLLERAYLTQVEAAAGGEKISFIGESIENGSATVRSKVVTDRARRSRSTTACTSATATGVSTTWRSRGSASSRATGRSSTA